MKGRLKSKRPRVVLYEGEGSRPLDDAQRVALLTALLEDGHTVTRPAGNEPVATADASDHLVLGRFETTPPTREDSLGGQVEFLDLGDLSVDAVRESVKSRLTATGADVPGGWKPWFPVIDYSRCTNCMQCLSFCLFDVYGVDEQQKIDVAHEDHCKTDCPACSRVCPEAAIMFPKYKKGPINGDIVRPEDLQSEAMKVDISALLGGDLYGALRTRQKVARERFSTERDESKALLERKRCLKKLGQALDIPDEVLMTLPSAGEIEDRARRAQEKMERRKERSQTLQDRKPATDKDWGI